MDSTDLLQMDGYDDALMGFAQRCGGKPVALYDADVVIDINMGMGMTYEEAIEYYEYNQLGSYVGESSPVFFHRFDDDVASQRKVKLRRYSRGE